jgi:MoxR-like ATPase
VRDLALDVLRHRVVLSYEALADDVSPDDILTKILNTVSLPDVPLRERRNRLSDAGFRRPGDA